MLVTCHFYISIEDKIIRFTQFDLHTLKLISHASFFYVNFCLNYKAIL